MTAGPSVDRLDPMIVSVAPNGSVGEVIRRSAAHAAPGVLHEAVSLQVVDPDGLWLLQRRAAGKPLFAGRWANTCCTHPGPGEAPADAVRRRAHEELGLVVGEVVAAGEFTYHAVDPASGLVEHERDRVFVAVATTDGIIPEAGEVEELARLPLDDALARVSSGDGAPWASRVLRLAAVALADA